MKLRLIGLVFVLSLCSSGWTQGILWNAGYNFSFGGTDSLNYVVDRYNDTRSYLDKKMDHFNILDGLNLGFSFVNYKGAFGMDLTWRGTKHSAEGTDATGMLQQRDIKVNFNTFGMTGGYVLDMGGNPLILGGRVDFGSFKVKTRVAPKEEIKDQDWGKAVKELTIALGVYAKLTFGNPGVYIEPYFMSIPMKVLRPDMAQLNNAINPGTAWADPSTMRLKYATFGVKVGLSFGSD